MFGTSPLDAVETAHIVWGLSPEALDLTGVNSLRNTTYDGRPLIDSSFMIDGNATRHVMNACAILRGSALVREAPDLAEGGTGRMVQCWPEAFGEWRTARGLSFPVEDATEATEALLQWLSAEGKKWAQDVGFRSLDDGNQELTYVKIRADTKLKLIFLHRRSVLDEVHTGWSQLIDRINEDAPESAKHAVQVLGNQAGQVHADMQNKWIQLTMHNVYASMSAWGLGVGLTVAFSVLLLVTRSPSISLIAVISLLQVIAGVFASLATLGWSVGIVEAICLILVSGLSVDYVLHVACAYAQAHDTSGGRIGRTEHALRRMGSPILAGTATTLVSAISLTTCTFVVLAKIGVFMTFTAGWSYLSAQTVLPALLATFGPYSGGSGGTVFKSVSSPRSFFTPRYKQSSSAAAAPVPAAMEMSATSAKSIELGESPRERDGVVQA